MEIGPAHPGPTPFWTSLAQANRAERPDAAPFDPLPGSVPFWRALEATNRTAGSVTPPAGNEGASKHAGEPPARRPDTVELSPAARAGTPDTPKISDMPPPAERPKPAKIEPRQEVKQTTGRGTIIDVTI